MRLGEIVRTPDGDFLRYVAECEYLDHGDGPFWELSSGTYWRCGIPGLEIVTVAELFEAAGHPAPEGAKLYRYSCEPESLPLDWIWQCSGKSAIFDDLKGEWGVVFNNPHFVADPDLSRLPALDAWYALPGVIKAVVK